MKYDLTILVPVYNEEATLSQLLNKLGKVQLARKAQLIVVNDGSHDKSQEIIDKWVHHNHASFAITAVNHPRNKGKGAAIQTALALAKGTYFVIQDADLEYDPAEIPGLLEVALTQNAPVIYGSRFLGTIDTMPRINYMANRFYNILLRLLYGIKMTDMHTCYKMIQTDLFKELKIHSQGFGYAPEVISKLLRRKIPIVEVPINFHGRNKRAGKKIALSDGLECLAQLLKYRFKEPY